MLDVERIEGGTPAEQFIEDDRIVGIEDNLRLRGGQKSWSEHAWNLYDKFQSMKRKRYYDQYLVGAHNREIPTAYTPRGPGQSYDIHYEYNPKKLKKDLERVTGFTAAMAATRMARRFRKRGHFRSQAEPETNLGGDTIIDKQEEMSNFLGKIVLGRRFEVQKMYQTMCYFNMSIIKNTDRQSATDPWIHLLEKGAGPCLYTLYDYGKVDVSSNRNYNFNAPQEPDADFANPSTSMKNVGTTSPVYVFAADWPWLIMNHDERTQPTVVADQKWRLLSWNYQPTTTGLNDTNIPLTMNDFITNPDWKYLKIFGIEYTFDFTNTFNQTMCCEILLFRFKSDPDAMDYNMQVNAPYARQTKGFKDYIVNPNVGFYPQDINIVSRKRYYIPGMEQNLGITTAWGQFANKNFKRVTLNVTRQYVLTRPILETTGGNLPEITENEFFNTYYEPHKGLYMRIQAWPLAGGFFLNTNTSMGLISDTAGIQDKTKPTAQDQGTTIAPGLDVRILKRAKYKFDSERISKLVN